MDIAVDPAAIEPAVVEPVTVEPVTAEPVAPDVEERFPEPTEELNLTIAEAVESLGKGVSDVDGVWPARHLFVTVSGTVLDDTTRDLLSVFKPGGVVLRGENLVDKSQTKRLIDQIKDAVGLGDGFADAPFIAISLEEDAGSGFGLEDMPSPWELGAGGDADQVNAVARAYAVSARKRGIGIILGPRLDVFRAESMGFEPKTRFLGENVGVVASVGLAFAERIRANGLLPVVGHYPGLGAATRGDNGALAILDDHKTLAVEVIFPFARAADSNIAGLLVGHIAVPVLDEDSPERPASLSPKLVHTLLRDLWSYEGLALADDVTLHPAVSGRPVEELVVEALLAGCDAVLLYDVDGARLAAVCRAVVDRAAVNSVLRERLTASKERLSNHLAMLGEPVPKPAGTERTLHTIQRGENLISIASKYGVYVDDLMAWNGLRDADINFGQQLAVYIPKPENDLEAALESEGAEPADADDTVAEAEADSVEPQVENAIPETPTELADDAEDTLPPEAPVDDETDADTATEVIEETRTTEEEPDQTVAPALEAASTEVDAEDSDRLEPFESDSADITESSQSIEISESETEDVPTTEVEPIDTEETDEGNEGSLEIPEFAVEDANAEVEASKPVEPSEDDEDSQESDASPSPPETSIEEEHIVVEGETISDIATTYGVTEDALRTWNDLEADSMEVGDVLIVQRPPDGETEEAFGYYTIQPGDRLHEVAVTLGTTKAKLIELNGLGDANLIKSGQELKYRIPAEQ